MPTMLVRRRHFFGLVDDEHVDRDLSRTYLQAELFFHLAVKVQPHAKDQAEIVFLFAQACSIDNVVIPEYAEAEEIGNRLSDGGQIDASVLLVMHRDSG